MKKEDENLKNESNNITEEIINGIIQFLDKENNKNKTNK